MKKLIFMVAAVLLLSVPAVMAQKVNKDAVLQKLAKSDAEIADAKKNMKAATWINRGKAYAESASILTKDIYLGMPSTVVVFNIGKPNSIEQVTVNNKELEAWNYDFITIYMLDGNVASWSETNPIFPGAVDVAIEAYNKAYSIDPGQAAKIKDGIALLSNYCMQIGDVSAELGEHKKSYGAYDKAFEAQSNPAFGTPDKILKFFAGYYAVVDGPKHKESFAKGVEDLKKALEMGYTDESGDIYYFLYHAYYGQKDTNPEFLPLAKQALLDGQAKYPKNENIFDAIVQLYTVEQGMGNINDLIPAVEEAIAQNPTNRDLWINRGRIFNALKNYDECIASFQKVVELDPEAFDGNYFLGVFYATKGDALTTEINDRQYVSDADFQADQQNMMNIYAQAVPYLEKAHEIKPDDLNTVQLLKEICYRVRDMEGMQPKFDKYNALFKEMN